MINGGMINGGLIATSAPSSTAVSRFEAALAALKPIRWYPLDDEPTGTARDLGSQKQNGSYVGSNNFNVSPGMIPTRKNCIGLTAPSDPGISIPAAGLPSGSAPWTFGLVIYITFRAGTYPGLQWSYNGLDTSGSDLILYHNGFTTGVTVSAHNIYVSTTITDALLLPVATYDGTTLKYYLYTPVRLLGSASTTVALNPSPTSPVLCAGNGDYQSQDAFILDYAATQAQITNLANNIQVVQ